MKHSSKFLLTLLLVFTLAVVPMVALASGLASTQVTTSSSGQVIKVKDDFSSLVDRNPAFGPEVLSPYFTADTIDSSGFFYGYNHGLVSKIVTKTEAGQTYAHFKISHDPTWDDSNPHYILADLEEGPSGHNRPSSGFLRWKPTVGNPVVMKLDMRFPGCHADGTGCGTGTAGAILWNGPVLPDNTLAEDYKSIGFNFASADSDHLIVGVTGGVIWDFAPIDEHAIADINPSNWNHYKMVWTQLEDGSQTVEYKVNGTLYGTTYFTAEEATDLGVLGTEIWLDNYSHVVFFPDGTFTVTYTNPVTGEARTMDIANYVVKFKDIGD